METNERGAASLQIHALRLSDPLMDLCLLAAVQLCFSKLNFKRLLAAMLFTGCCTFAVLAVQMQSSTFLHMPVLLLAAAIASGEQRPARMLQAAMCMLGISAASAGFCLLFNRSILPIMFCLPVCILLFRRRIHSRFQWNVEIQAEACGNISYFPALIDTGNRLREHSSGLPVLIVEAQAAPEMAELLDKLEEKHIHSLPFGVLGGSGSIACFHPDKISIHLPGIGYVNAPECCLAIYPGRIPGPTRALAPPEFWDAIQYNHSFFIKILHRLRRFSHHVFFKRQAVHLWFGGSDSKGFGLLHWRQRSASASSDP